MDRMMISSSANRANKDRQAVLAVSLLSCSNKPNKGVVMALIKAVPLIVHPFTVRWSCR